MSNKQSKKSPVPAICSVLGTAILIFIILICIPFTIPKFLGGQIYTVISGSMEPEIPVGSLVYVEGAKSGMWSHFMAAEMPMQSLPIELWKTASLWVNLSPKVMQTRQMI